MPGGDAAGTGDGRGIRVVAAWLLGAAIILALVAILGLLAWEGQYDSGGWFPTPRFWLSMLLLADCCAAVAAILALVPAVRGRSVRWSVLAVSLGTGVVASLVWWTVAPKGVRGEV